MHSIALATRGFSSAAKAAATKPAAAAAAVSKVDDGVKTVVLGAHSFKNHLSEPPNHTVTVTKVELPKLALWAIQIAVNRAC